MMDRTPRRRVTPPLTAGAVLALLAAPAAGQQVHGDQGWCRDVHRGDGERACEVREWQLDASGRLAADARPNGSIRVRAWDGDRVRVLARLTARAGSPERAEELLSEIRVRAEGSEVATELPDTGGREGASVSYRIQVPRRTDLELSSSNGALEVDGVAGRLDLHTTNGGIRLAGVAGSVEARTINGGIEVALAGDGWSGSGLEAATTNGGIDLTVPDGLAADLSAATTNGGIRVDFPVTVRGRVGRELRTALNGGGPPVSLRTTNGGIRIRRSG